MLWLVLLVACGGVAGEEPSCEELRELWAVVSRSAEASRRTNHIPLLPPLFEGRKPSHRRLLTPKAVLSENRVPDAGHSFYAPQAEAFGRYVDAWPSQGATKKGAAQWWGVPEEVGMFGRFVDFEEGLPVISRDGPDMPGMSPIVKEPCHKVANRLCQTDEHCECSNWGCYRGRCQSHYINKDQDEFEYWHDSALPRSKLGLMKRPIRSTKSIFM